MAIIIRDHEPSGQVEEVQLPGSDQRFTIPTSEVLTVGDVRALTARGDFDLVYKHFPPEAHPFLDRLTLDQFNELVAAWLATGGDPKDSESSPA